MLDKILALYPNPNPSKMFDQDMVPLAQLPGPPSQRVA